MSIVPYLLRCGTYATGITALVYWGAVFIANEKGTFPGRDISGESGLETFVNDMKDLYHAVMR